MPINELTEETNDAIEHPAEALNSSAKIFNFADPSSVTFDPRILVEKSEKEVRAIRDELRREIKPRGFIERMYVDEMAAIIWDIRFYRRIKTSLMRLAMQPALRGILTEVTASKNFYESAPIRQEAKRLAAGWQNNKKDEIKVEKTLSQFYLDEIASKPKPGRA
jgi:hypothetical protein